MYEHTDSPQIAGSRHRSQTRLCIAPGLVIRTRHKTSEENTRVQIGFYDVHHTAMARHKEDEDMRLILDFFRTP